MNNRRWFLFGFSLMIVSFVFAMIETWYFGWNLHPESKAEWICDFIAEVVCSIGTGAVLYSILGWGYDEYTEIINRYRS